MEFSDRIIFWLEMNFDVQLKIRISREDEFTFGQIISIFRFDRIHTEVIIGDRLVANGVLLHVFKLDVSHATEVCRWASVDLRLESARDAE